MKKKIITLLAIVGFATLGAVSTTHANGWDNDWDRWDNNRYWNNNWNNNYWGNNWNNRWNYYPCWNNNWYW